MNPPPHSFPPGYLEANIGGRVIAVAIAFIPTCIIFICLRCYSQHLRKASRGMDDLLVIVSGVMLIGWSIIGICMVKFAGVGRHLAALEVQDPQVVTVYFKFLLVLACYYYTMVAVPKLAILALYSRLLTLEPYRTMIRVLAAVLILSATVIVIMCLNLCRPFAANWDPYIPGGKCMDQQAFYTYASLPNIVTDVAMLVLPIPVVWKLHSSTKVKLGLVATFLTGSLGLVTSILRFVVFTRGNAIKDGTWATTELMIWSIIEPNVYLISACLLAMRPILSRLCGGETSKYGSSGYNSNFRPSGGASGGFSGGPKASRPAQNMPFPNPFDSALYGDEIHLVSVAERDVEADREGCLDDQIHVHKDMNVVVDGPISIKGERAGS